MGEVDSVARRKAHNLCLRRPRKAFRGLFRVRAAKLTCSCEPQDSPAVMSLNILNLSVMNIYLYHAIIYQHLATKWTDLRSSPEVMSHGISAVVFIQTACAILGI